ncbi:MAG: hypothetical protein ACREX8_15625 [Gammaproteobacteria bacterium]
MADLLGDALREPEAGQRAFEAMGGMVDPRVGDGARKALRDVDRPIPLDGSPFRPPRYAALYW